MASWLFALGNILFLGIQGPLASVSGRISDAETGAPIAGVVVSVPALGRATLSDSLGRYLIDGLPAGTYELVARRVGYAPWSVQVLLAEGATVDVAFALRPEPVRIPEIEALAPGPQVSSASQPTPGQSVVGRIRGVTSAELSTHPLLPEPDYFVAVSGGEVYVAPESPEGMHLLGGSTDQVDYVLDGIPVLNPYHAGGTFSAWNPDALSHADLTMSPLAGGAAQVLGGTLVGHIPAPGTSLETRGAITASHTRIRLSTPLGTQGGGALIGLRTGFAGLLGHQSDATYLGGGNHDWLARLELPAVGGRFFILGYGSADHLSALTASALAALPSATEARHHFAWSSESYGAGWSGPLRGWLLQLRGWVAGTQADAGWFGSAAPEVLTSSRRDLGFTATIEQISAVGSTAIGIRAVQSGSDYWARRPEAAEGTMRLMTDQVLLSASVEHRRSLSTRVGVQGSLVGTWTMGGSAVGPSAGLWWQPAGPVTLSVSYTRRQQFIQSLRNPESVAGAVFPADLSVGSGSATFPAARSDLGLVSIDYRPAGTIRIAARAYARTTAGQALIAVREAGPFATGPVAVGSASTRGAVLEIGAVWRRVRLLGSYGYQDSRVEADGMRYRPSAAVPHTIDAGMTLAPAINWSVRLGVGGQFGRRATAVRGPFEWESCNLRDRGCEFAGSPELVGPIGGVALPGYLRVDLGLRREWSVTLFGRAGTLAAFGTATNLLGRRNLLTTMVDPGTGARDPVEMRPRSPLAIGFDWRF